MIEIEEKRGRWCYIKEGRRWCFSTEEEARSSLGLETIDNGSQKEKDNDEKKDSKAKDYFQAPHSKTTLGNGKKDTSSKGKKN